MNSPSILLTDFTFVNEGQTRTADIFIRNGIFEKIGSGLNVNADLVIQGSENLRLLPGLIDDQVHFREPGLTSKADIASESRAALAGGITSFMEMPNTIPPTLNRDLLEEKYQIAARNSPANYSFYMGVSNDNYDEVVRTDPRTVCGIKIFMGSSTGNLLVDNEQVLERIFANAPTLIATHCEDEATVRLNKERALAQYGNQIPVVLHPVIRNGEACYLSSFKAVRLAKKYGTRLHILHISTEKELSLFDNSLPLKDKKITAEACLHHLWFSDEDYAEKGNFIKWNPAVKSAAVRAAVRAAVNDNRIDVLATDHAPHTLTEKTGSDYLTVPSGGPLVQHALPVLLDLVQSGVFTLEKVVEKYCHAPAVLFQIENRGFIREGYKADAVIANLNAPFTVNKSNLLYKCGWSPFEEHTFSGSVEVTFVNGIIKYQNGKIMNDTPGERLLFNR